MSSTVLRMTPAFLFLCGCVSPSLEGLWTGEMDCTDENGWMELEADMSLEDVGDGEFTGHFEADGEATLYGDSYSVRVEADLELELTDDAGGSQRLTGIWTNCELWLDSEYLANDDACPPGEDWHWDGEDEIDNADDDGCTLILNR